MDGHGEAGAIVDLQAVVLAAKARPLAARELRRGYSTGRGGPAAVQHEQAAALDVGAPEGLDGLVGQAAAQVEESGGGEVSLFFKLKKKFNF